MGNPVPRLSFTCRHCGATFQRMACETRHKPVRFCSRACLYASRRSGETKPCAQCGQAFYRKAGDAGPYCSRKCSNLAAITTGNSYPKVGSRHAHRIAAERKLGRSLLPGEIAHHVDEDKKNFSADNIEILPSQSEHARLHFLGTKQSPDHVRKRMESKRKTLMAKNTQ